MTDADVVRSRAEAALPSHAGSLAGRRLLFATLVGATVAATMALGAAALSAHRPGVLDAALLVLLFVTRPWTVIGFWNAVIGLMIMRFSRHPAAAVTPAAARGRGDEDITSAVALLMCIRNEDPRRVLRNLRPMLQGLAAVGHRFHLYLLSDTDDPAIAAAEQQAFAELQRQWHGRIAVTWRRRADNAGFKAGNLRDFCLRFGAGHDLAVTLDADSFMPAAAILRMVRIMQASPEIGILQGIAAGMPSTSAFARIFQFGMRLGLWSYTLGSAWWQGDCGPHWGHNSVLRLKPFAAACAMPEVPGSGPLSGHVLSHDQVEAVLMRRAGWEVRVLVEDDLGFEENPPTLIEFIRRDIRWCQGNMQYLRLLTLPGLKPVSRCQLALAVLMFIGSPAWIGLLVLGSLGAIVTAPQPFIAPGPGTALLVAEVVMWFAPQIATVLDTLPRRKARWRYGGGTRLVANLMIDMVFIVLLWPIMWCAHTIFLGALLLGRSVSWGGQARDGHRVPVATAIRRLWPQTVLGWGVVAALATAAPAALPYALVMAGGLALAVPLCVVTASRRAGAFAVTAGIGRLPEEVAPSPLDALGLAAARPGAMGLKVDPAAAA